MSSPWSAPDAGTHRPGPVPPPPPPPPGVTPVPGAPTTPGTTPAVENPFAPPSEDLLSAPVVPGSVYGQRLPAGAYGPAPVWPTLPGTDPLAVWALVLGIIGLIILPVPFSMIALGLGIASLLRIRKGLRSGKGLAIAGVVLGALGTLATLAVGALFGVLMFAGTGL